LNHLSKNKIIISVFLFIFSTVSISMAAETRQKVLVLHSYHHGLKWTDDITKGIQECFNPYKLQFELYYEYLDTKRNTGKQYMQNLYQIEKGKLLNTEFSLVLIADNNALTFVKEHGKELLGNIPMVFCGINNFNLKMLGELTNITGVVERTDFEGGLALIKKLHPERKNITIIIDSTPTGDAIYENMKPALLKFPDMKFNFYRDFLFTDVGGMISQLDTSDVIYLLTFNRDKNDNFKSYTEGIKIIRNASSVPIYGSWDFYLGKGIVGGILTCGVNQGKNAAKMALAILNGQLPSTIPINYNGATSPIFDHQELERFNISPKDLLSNSLIINEPPTLMDRYAKYAFLLIGLLIIISLVMELRLLIIRRRNKRLVKEKETLDIKVKQRTQQIEEEKFKLEETLTQVKMLQGLLPICSSCKKIRDDQGYWNQIENYISKHTDAEFSQGICPDCSRDIW